MFFLNVYTYLHTVSRHTGNIEDSLLREYGFNFENFFHNKWYILVTSNFLHFNYGHLFANMLLLMVFGGILEFIGGTTLAALAYLLSMNANIPTGIFVLPIFQAIDFYGWHVDVHYLDVGASLGVMGLLGALLQFVKAKGKVLAVVSIGLFLVAVLQNNFIGTDHCFALLMGYLTAHVYLNRGFPKSVFRTLFVSYDSPSQSKSAIPFRNHNR
jgi:membrane associated rhomboid family serine protease